MLRAMPTTASSALVTRRARRVGGGAPGGDPLDDGRAARPAGARRRRGSPTWPWRSASARRWSSTTSAPRTTWSPRPSRTPWSATCAGSRRRPSRRPTRWTRLRRVLRLYGPTGRATGWRIWIDAWAVAQRDPHIRKVLKRLDQQLAGHPARRRRRRRRGGRLHLPRPGGDGGPHLRAGRRALGRGAGAPQVTREQLRSWVAGAARRELGVDVETAATDSRRIVTPASAAA